MVLERDAVTGNRIETRQRIIRPRQQPVTSLINDHENDVVGWRTAGLLRLQVATSENHRQANGCQQS
jgi:hypothetical protein